MRVCVCVARRFVVKWMVCVPKHRYLCSFTLCVHCCTRAPLYATLQTLEHVPVPVDATELPEDLAETYAASFAKTVSDAATDCLDAISRLVIPEDMVKLFAAALANHNVATSTAEDSAISVGSVTNPPGSVSDRLS